MNNRSNIRGTCLPAGLAVALALGLSAVSLADDRPGSETGSRTVIGETNPDLAEGARRLIAGDTEEGIRLTRLGLDVAAGSRERQAGLSNLCAGYLRLEQYEVALGYCNSALDLNPRNWRALCNRALTYIMLGQYDDADIDLDLAESIAPSARSIKETRARWRDATDPVVPTVVIDDRRDPESADDVPAVEPGDDSRQ